MTALALGLLVGTSALVTVLQMRALGRGLAEARKEVSRYPLYQARDQLVRLVASGRMDENDEAWQAAYASANNLLSIHERLDLRSTLRRMDRFRASVSSDHRLRREIELMERALRRASRDVEGFRDAIAAIDNGFWIAMHRQTTGWDLLFVHLKRRVAETFAPAELSTWADRNKPQAC